MVINDALRAITFGVRFKSCSVKQAPEKHQSLNTSTDAVPVASISNVSKCKTSLKRGRESEIEPKSCKLRLTSTMTALNEDDTVGPERKKKSRTQVEVKEGKTNRQNRDSEAQDIRQRHKIYVWGSDVAEPSETFENMLRRRKCHLRTVLLENVQKMGFVHPTPVQMQAIPQMLHRREILACAPTGSGKTLAFVLPVLYYLGKKGAENSGRVRAVVVEPTRELARQTYHVIRRLCEGTVVKVHMARNLNASRKLLDTEGIKHYDVLVSTPKRIVGLVGRKIVDLSAVRWLVVDESDKLFESGPGNMREQLAVIYNACDNVHLRRAFFSATFSFEVEEWCKLNLDNVVTICVGKRNSAVSTVEQELKFVGDEYGKVIALKDVFRSGIAPPILIFVQTKERAEQLFNELKAESMRIDLMHSGRSQERRNDALSKFRSGEIFVLICTELLGRGIDFKCVNVVINYDLPQSPISYIHRIGRTGRAGRRGRAITLFTEADKVLLRPIANVMKISGCDVPDYMLTVPKPDKKLKQKLAKTGIKRKVINLSTKGAKVTSKRKPRRRWHVKSEKLQDALSPASITNEPAVKTPENGKKR